MCNIASFHVAILCNENGPSVFNENYDIFLYEIKEEIKCVTSQMHAIIAMDVFFFDDLQLL